MKKICSLAVLAMLIAFNVQGQRLTPDERKAKVDEKRKRAAEKKHNRWAPRRFEYKNNVTCGFQFFTVTPFIIGLPAIGLGLEYERFIKDGRLSVHMPIYYEAAIAHMGPTLPNAHIKELTALFSAPGIRYHLFQGMKPFDVSVGGQLAVGNYNIYEYILSQDGTKANEVHNSQIMLAPLAELDVTNNPGKKHYLLGLHFAIGPQIANGAVLGTVVQVGFRGGVRF